MINYSPAALATYAVAILLVTAAIAPLFSSRQRFLIDAAFVLCAIASSLGAIAGFLTVSGGIAETLILPIGLPELPFYARLDALSGFFIATISILSLFVSIYSIGYVKGFLGHRSVTSLVVFYCLFLAGMLLVLVSDDAYFFLISWELMAVSSFFLVCFENERAEARRAAFIYIVIAHIGAVLILLSFGIIAGASTGFENFSSYTFAAMRSSVLTPGWTSAAFILAFTGFAAKAGVIPLHVWLPEAHPAAPSNVSALMSGAMLKTAIYGILRMSFDVLHVSNWKLGGIVLAFGLITALLGIIHAIMQTDLKRALAYSSIENIGIILISIGLAVIFKAHNLGVLAALALTAALYHTLNHALFKGLLFMGAGAILHATHERSMEAMGGLIHKLPFTSVLFLVGCISISSLPPFNGFVSEWLAFQAFLLSPVLSGQILKLLIPLGAAMLALSAALSARCFVKVYGVTFLGHWRGKRSTYENAHEVNSPMKIGMALAAVSCLALGIFPVFVISWLDTVPLSLVSANIGSSAQAFGWLWLTPISGERASYSAPIVLIGIAAIVAIAYFVFHAANSRIRRSDIWDCGYKKLTPRMQYTSTSFAMPLRRIFGFIFSIDENVRTTDQGAGRFFMHRFTYHLHVVDRFWKILYKPFVDASFWAAGASGRLQHGRIQIYLLYSFITLILLLVFS